MACAILGGWLVERLWGPAPTGMVVDHRWYRGVISLKPPLVAQNWDQSVFAGIGWFVVVGVVAGLLVGLVTAVFLARSELAALAAVVVSTVAAGFVMYAVATAFAPDDPAPRAATSPNGTVLADTLHLGSHWIVLVCPAGGLAAVATVFLMFHPRGSARRTTAP